MARGFTEVVVDSHNLIVPSGVSADVQNYYTAVYAAGNPSLWFDPSIDPVVSLSPDGKDITSILEMTRTIPFAFVPPPVSQGVNHSAVDGLFKHRAINAAYGGFTIQDANPATGEKIEVTTKGVRTLTHVAVLAVDKQATSGIYYLSSETGSKTTYGIAQRSGRAGGLALVYEGGVYFLAASSQRLVDAWTRLNAAEQTFVTDKAVFTLSVVQTALPDANSLNFDVFVDEELKASFTYRYPNFYTSDEPAGSFLVTDSFGSGGDGVSRFKAVAEQIAYPVALNRTALTSLTQYLKDKWIPAAIPVVQDIPTVVGKCNNVVYVNVVVSDVDEVSVTNAPCAVNPAWTVVKNTATSFTISTTLPGKPTSWVINVVGTSGGASVTKRVRVVATPTGSLDAYERAVYASSPSFWFDSTSASSSDKTGDRITSIVERANAIRLGVTSTETPSQYTKDFTHNSFAYSSQDEASLGSGSLTIDYATLQDKTDGAKHGALAVTPQNEGTIVMVGRYDPAHSLQQVIRGLCVYSAADWTGIQPAGLTVDGDISAMDTPTSTGQAGFVGMQGVTSTEPDELGIYASYGENGNAPSGIANAVNKIQPGDRWMVAWCFEGTTLNIYLNKQLVQTVYGTGDFTNLNSQGLRFDTIATTLNGVEPGQLCCVATIPGPPSRQSTKDALDAIYDYWLASAGRPPTIGVPSPDSQYAGLAYEGTVNITNGTTDPVYADFTPPSGWTITQVSNGKYLVKGTMPQNGDAVIQVSATQSRAQAAGSFKILSVPRPAAPIIGNLNTDHAPAGTVFTASLPIENYRGPARSLSVTANAGSNWSIAQDPNGPATQFVLTGTLPGSIAFITVTVQATSSSDDGKALSASTRNFLVESTKPAVFLDQQRPLDQTGKKPTNLIVREQHTLTRENGINGQFIVPVMAPFYEEGLIVEVLVGGEYVPLAKGDHYKARMQLQEVSETTDFPVFGAISIDSPWRTGPVYVTYQTLGGPFVFDFRKIYGAMLGMVIGEKSIDFANVINLPTFWKAADHVHSSKTIVGLKGLVDAFDQLTATTLSANSELDLKLMRDHILRKDDPHRVSTEQLDLEKVPNYPPATIADSEDPTNDQTLLTPFTANHAAAAFAQRASTTKYGIGRLNSGVSQADAVDAEKALTADGAVRLMKSTNSFSLAFTGGDGKAQVKPAQMVFPLYWKGLLCRNLAELINYVELYTGVAELTFNRETSTFYFPKGVPVPDLTTSQTQSTGPTVQATVNSPCNYPLTYDQLATPQT